MLERFVDAVLDVESTTWVALSFLPIAALFVWALWKADRGEASTFKFVHFVTNDVGRGSSYALGYTTLVVTCAWGVWALIVLDRLTEWYMTIVCSVFVLGYAAGTGARLIAKLKGAPDPKPDAGDTDAEPAPAIERTTRTEETVRVPQPAATAVADPPKGSKSNRRM